MNRCGDDRGSDKHNNFNACARTADEAHSGSSAGTESDAHALFIACARTADGMESGSSAGTWSSQMPPTNINTKHA